MKKRIGFLCLALNIVLLAYLCLGSVVALDDFLGVGEQNQITGEAFVLGDEDEQSSEGIELAVSPIAESELEEELQPMMATSSGVPLPPTSITGYSSHALDKMAQLGISQSQVNAVFNNGSSTWNGPNWSWNYSFKGVTVAVNPSGQVTTVFFT